MIISPTLSKYIAKQFIINTAIVFTVIAFIVVMLDFVELMRRSADSDISMTTIFQLSLLKLPYTTQQIIPFNILIGSILTFSKLSKNYELIVARAAGISAWQFLSPALIISVLLGVLVITVWSPLSALVINQYKIIENQHIKHSTHSIVSDSGLWLRESNKERNTRTIIHASRVSSDTTELYDVIFLFNKDNQFSHRIDAQSAKLVDNAWNMESVVLTQPNKPAIYKNSYKINTTIKLKSLHDNFSTPETISFWQLSSFIKTLEETGFSTLKHRLHWHKLLVNPFMFCAMVLIAAAFSLQPPRSSKAGILITAGLFTGFCIYYISGLISALGESGSIPIIVAAWFPVIISLIAGIAILFHLEDG